MHPASAGSPSPHPATDRSSSGRRATRRPWRRRRRPVATPERSRRASVAPTSGAGGPDRQASPARRCPRHHVTLTASPPVGIGESDGAGRRPWNGHTPQLGRREVADRCARPVEGEQDGDAVHAMCQAVAPGAFEVVGGDEDASPQSHPAPGPGQVLDLGVPVSRGHGFGRGEHSEAAFGRCAQDGMHRQSVAASGMSWGDAPGACGRDPRQPPRNRESHHVRRLSRVWSGPGAGDEQKLGDPRNTSETPAVRVGRKVEWTTRKIVGTLDHQITAPPQRTEERPSP
jgi:hypothetical protein